MAAFALYANAQGPSATSFEYVVKSYQELESGYELAVLTGKIALLKRKCFNSSKIYIIMIFR